MAYQDVSQKNIGLNFDVKVSKINYLGTLYLDYHDSLTTVEPIKIPLKMHNRPKGMAYSVLFGMVGASTFLLSNNGVIDTLNVKIRHDETFTPISETDKQVHNSYLQ